MSTFFGGRQCLDPAQEASNCRDLGYALGPWVGDANGFTCPLGQAPGRGRILMRRADLDAIDREALHDLVFRESQNVVTLKNLLIVRAVAITPGYRSDPQAAYWAEIADKRYLCRGVPFDRSYNVRSAPGGDYYSASLNAGSNWTWTDMVQNIWDAVGKLGTWPGLPVTPDGEPEGWQFFGSYAYDALGRILDRIGCALRLDPTTGVFTIVRIGTVDATAELAMQARENARVGDDDPLDPVRARVPANVRVLFAKQRENFDQTGSSPWYAVDVAGSYSAAESGTYALIHDDLPAIYDDTDTLTNSSDLATRAAERAADYYRRVTLTHLRREFSGAAALAGLLPGSQVHAITWRERGGLGLTTEVMRGPGTPAPVVPYGFGGAAPTTDEGDVLEVFNTWNIEENNVENVYNTDIDILNEFNTDITVLWTQLISLISSYSWVFVNPTRVCSWLYWCYTTITLSSYGTNNLSLASSKKIVYRFTTSADAEITGVVAGAGGHLVLFVNCSAYTISLRDESASSTAANRFSLPGGTDLDLGPDAVALLWYDKTDLRWKVLAPTGGSGGLSGTGTTNYLAEWTSANTLGDSPISDHDGVVEIHSRGLVGPVANINTPSPADDVSLPDALTVTFQDTTSSGTEIELSGFAGGTLGRILFLWNKHNARLILKKSTLGTGSTLGNQFALDNDHYIPSGGGVILFYNATGFWALVADIGNFGTVGVSGGGTGLTSTPANGELLIGNGTGFTLDTLTAGTNITITNGAGTITISASSGTTWYSGSGVPGGGTGADGDFYLRTSNGDVYVKAAGTWSVTANLTGPTGATGTTGATGATGAAGAPGSVWYQGSGVPGGGTGINGDFYLDTANGNVYQKSGGSWSLAGNILGPSVADGDKGDITVSGSGSTWTIDANVVSDSKLRQSAALSVIGRSANSTGNVADIAGTASSDAVLRVSGTSLGFGTVATAGLAANAVTDAKLRQSSGLSVIGRSANSTGDVADITAGTDAHVLRRSGTTLGFGQIGPASIGAKGCRLTASSTSQTGSTGTYTAVLFDGEDIDTDSFHSTVSNTTRITIPSGMGGKYLIGGCVDFDVSATGVRYAKIYKNGTTNLQIESRAPTATLETIIGVTTIADLAAGDYIEIMGFQDSGGNLKTNVNGHAKFWCIYLGT